MSNKQIITVPDIGSDQVDVIEILVSVGDKVDAEDSIITLESDKATMDVPSPVAGTISAISLAVGDKVSEGAAIAEIETEEATDKQDKSIDSRLDQSPESNTTQTTKAPVSNQKSTTTEPIKGDHHAPVLVIGAGPGGYTAAFRAADLDLDVTLIERYDSLGGVCLNVGCIPSKALLHSADVISQARAMANHGVSFGEPKIDIDKLRGFKEGVIKKLTQGLGGMAKQRKVTVKHGFAKFTSSHSVSLTQADGSEQIITFDKCIIAAGSRVTIFPAFESDDERIIDSTGALELRDIPKSMLIIGGGIIGLEMATVYSELGSKITIVELTDQLIPGADKDLVKPLHKRLETSCEAIHINTKVDSLESNKQGIKVTFSSGDGKLQAPDAAIFDKVLVATGRRPNGDLLDADKAGVSVDERGFIAVDKQMRTNIEHIFAIGDIVGQPMLAHKATHEAKVAAQVCAGHKSAFEANVIPSVAYTDPEIAWVGLTQNQAKQQNTEHEVANFPWAASGRAIGLDRTEGKTKVLFDPKTDRLLGVGIVGPHAGDLIAEACLAIEMGADAQDIGLTIHPHPTLSETFAMASEMFEGTITDLYIPKRK